MKLSKVVLATAFLLNVGSGQQIHNRTRMLSTRLRLYAEADPASVKAGSPVTIRVRLQNISSRTVRLGDSEPIFNYGIAVTDAFGNEPPRTDLGNRFLHGTVQGLRQDVIDLRSGEEERAVLEVTKLFQLTRPGTYFVRVNRGAIWTEKDEDNDKFIEEVFSGAAQFTIVP